MANKKQGIIGILFGYLGIHDFMAKKPVQGLLHLVLTFLPSIILVIFVISSFFVGFKCGTGDTTGCKTGAELTIEHTMNAIINVLYQYIIPISFACSWGWGIIEGIISLSRTSRNH